MKDSKMNEAGTAMVAIVEQLTEHVDGTYGTSHEKWLAATLCADRELRSRRDVLVVDGPEFHGRHGASAGLVWLNDGVRLGSAGHDRVAGSQGLHGWRLHDAFPAPAEARGDVELPETAGELMEHFRASVRCSDSRTVVVERDCVVPPLYGAEALTVVVPTGMKVRALGGFAGHNTFVFGEPAAETRPGLLRRLTGRR